MIPGPEGVSMDVELALQHCAPSWAEIEAAEKKMESGQLP